MPQPLIAGLWGLLAGSALVLGAVIGFYARVPQRLIAAIMAFGSGVLVSALSFELMDEAYRRGGITAAGVGFIAGGVVYTIANSLITRRGGKHRKRSSDLQPAAHEEGSGLALAVGALLDGIPESLVIGISMLGGRAVSLIAVAAVFLSNVPEGLSSSAGMRKGGRGAGYVFAVWGGIAVISGISAVIGYSAFRGVRPEIIAGTTTTAAGAILAMIADTMLPEAFESAHDFTGIIVVAGFLCAFVLSKLA